MYVVVNRENAVLSRTSPDALLSWAPWEGAGSLPAGAITFETLYGATMCAGMQGGSATRIADLACSGDSVGRVGDGRDTGVVAVGG